MFQQTLGASAISQIVAMVVYQAFVWLAMWLLKVSAKTRYEYPIIKQARKRMISGKLDVKAISEIESREAPSSPQLESLPVEIMKRIL
jgi:hypothetical protein